MFIVSPLSDDFIDDFTITGGATAAAVLAKPRLRIDEPAVGPIGSVVGGDLTFVQGAAAVSGTLTCLFDWPGHYVSRDYGDGSQHVVLPVVRSVRLHGTIRSLAGVISPLPVMRRGGTVTNLDVAWTTTSSAFVDFVTVDLPLDPSTGLPWSLVDIVSTGFGILAGPAAGLAQIVLTRLFLSIEDEEAIGDSPARIGPERGEPARFCAICSTPFHLSQLVRVVEPLHPLYNHWVCAEDYDESMEVLEDNLRGTSLSEGDIDFDQE